MFFYTFWNTPVKNVGSSAKRISSKQLLLRSVCLATIGACVLCASASVGALFYFWEIF